MEPDQYARELNEQFTYLFAFTRAINELDMAAALFGEFRGAQDAGWSTSITAYEVFGEFVALGTRGAPLEKAEHRQVLCLYAHLSEAGGVYEALLNQLRVVQLKPYNMWPFQDMVRVTAEPRRIIGPNANAMFRRLAQTADAIGMKKLAELIAVTFNDDIRNAISHADYIIGLDGLRLRRRNGGNAYTIRHEDLSKMLSIGLMFFDLFDQTQRQARQSFQPARRIVGRFSANPPMAWTVESDEQGGFSISSNSIGCESDAAYDRQQLINKYLGGRVVAVFILHGEDEPTCLLEEIAQIGLSVLLVELDAQSFEDLENEVEQHQLWDPGVPENSHVQGLLVVTPFGFRRIADINAFRACLPSIEELEIV